MRKLNEYFTNVAMVFAVSMICIVGLHIVNDMYTMQISSIVKLLMLVSITQIILVATENLRIQSGIMHITVELILMEVIVFAVGIPLQIINISEVRYVIGTMLMVALIEGITSASYFIRTQQEVTIINKLLKERDE